MFDRELRRLMMQLYWFNFRLSLIHKLHALSPARCFEYPLAFRSLNLQAGSAVLDIGSGKSCFPLFMVTKAKANVTVIDPSQTVMVQKMYAQKVGILGGMIPESFDLFDNPKHGIAADTYATPDERLTIRVADATRMDFADAAFDAVACVSTIEHISDDGDIPAIREIARVLKPGGRAFISVPYAQEYKEGRTHGGAFERMYDPAALRTRLVEPSGLAVAAEGFLVDRKSRKITDATYYNLPGRWRYMLGWYCVFLAFWLSSRDRASATDAQFAYLLLSKK